MLDVQQRLATKEEFYEFVMRPENRDRNFEYIAGELSKWYPTTSHQRQGAILFTLKILKLKAGNGR